jgi:uncharacterized protein (DUF3820 family)
LIFGREYGRVVADLPREGSSWTCIAVEEVL